MNKICPRCQTPNLAEAMFCASCAAPLGPTPTAAAPPNQQAWTPPAGQGFGNAPAPKPGASGKALTSFLLALAGLVLCCGPLTGIPAAIVGWMELGAINAGQSSPAGRWMAQVGIWGGIAVSVLSIFFFIGWIFLSMMAAGGAYY